MTDNTTLEYLSVDRPNPQALIIALHGFGANNRDLRSFSTFGTYPYSWRFLQAPIHLGGQGYSWFPRNLNLFSTIDPLTYFHNLPTHDEPDLAIACDQVIHTIESMNIPSSLPIVLAGFSQGAVVCTQLLVQGLINCQAALLFSAMPVNSKKIEKTLRSSQKDGSSTNIMLPPVFQSHGLNDTVLPLTLGEQLKAIIKPNCSQYRYEVFPGFHEVPDFILHRALEFLDEALAEKDNK